MVLEFRLDNSSPSNKATSGSNDNVSLERDGSKPQDAIEQIADLTTKFLWREKDPKAQDASRLPW